MTDEDNTPTFKHYYLPTDPDHMRQPTNLELAVLSSLQSNYQLTQIQLVLVDRDLMSEDEDYLEAILAFNAAAEAITAWWKRLLYDEADMEEHVHTVEEDDD